MSVTATENCVMAAALADGESTLLNAASEPHVQDMCAVLVEMGAKISGLGTSKLVVTGVAKLHGGTFTINTDYHEVVTFLALGAITGGEVKVKNSLPHHFDLMTRAFQKLGVTIEHKGDTAIVRKAQSLERSSTKATPPSSGRRNRSRLRRRSRVTCCRKSKRRRGRISPSICSPA
jgi:UDP-N-acetylglucosamine 1-carboxyvinyltransferase